MKNLCPDCKICNGRRCRNTIPGPGAKGIGDTAMRNYDKWQEIRVNMDTIHAAGTVSTAFDLFGNHFTAPVFAGPVGSVSMHYGDKHNDSTYSAVLVQACAEAGIAAFTGDGTDPVQMISGCASIKKAGGRGIPTVKPWALPVIKEKYESVKDAGAFAVAMDIDAAGLPFLKNSVPPAGSKSVQELKEIIEAAHLPFIVKGIMTVKGAKKAVEAGADAIVVSNHGGRVLDQCPATAEVLEEIADAVGKDTIVLVDGGIRTGTDVFKALALGARAVLIARPFVKAVYTGEGDAVRAYAAQLTGELEDAMRMCGAASLDEITRDMVRI